MMRRILKKLFVVSVVIAAAQTVVADPYKVRVQLSEDEDGAMAYLINFDTKEKIDSVLVSEKIALFKGEVDEPFMARAIVDGQPVGTFVLETGSIVIDPAKRRIFGSELNDKFAEISDHIKGIVDRHNAASDQKTKEMTYHEYASYIENVMAENIDNPIGYYMFIDEAQSMDPAEFEGWLKKYPDLANYQRVALIKESFAKKAATSVGQMFKDFEVTYDGKTSRLSDYVGKGKYVLVDFWASWCGPCLRQIPVLKELLAEYGDKGLEVLGVAVWDEPQNTIKAIESHGITWPCIIDAQRIPTDIYGINGIPCIILYGPDGKILSRDKQGDELKADVRAAFEAAGQLK